MSDRVECPSCGGAGGGPIGRAGSAWDDESYVCPRCDGAGVVALPDGISQRPGIVKAALEAAAAAERARKATG